MQSPAFILVTIVSIRILNLIFTTSGSAPGLLLTGKEVCSCLCRMASTLVPDTLPFRISTDHTVYLGISNATNPKLLFKLNDLDLIDKLKILIAI